MYLEFIALIAGLLGLWFGSDLLIRSGKTIARHYGISYFFFGLAFVAIGTSIPEIAVSIAGALDRLVGIETSGLVVGNMVGSALSQIAFIMGFLLLFTKMKFDGKKKVYRQGAMLIGSVLLFFLLALDGNISKLDAGTFLFAYAIYYIYLYLTEKVKAPGKPPEINLTKSILLTLGGLVFVLVSSEIVVKFGVEIAQLLGVKQSLIGVLLIGLGTGLPELSIAIMAIRHKVFGISMGALVGSNICDLLLATGAGAIISGFLVDRVLLTFDIPILFLFTLLFFYMMWRQKKLARKEGIILISLYLVYALIKIFYVG